MRLVLDAGHGGEDPGAVALDLHESKINLAVVLTMRALLAQIYPEWEVRLTRVEDAYVSPGARARMIIRVQPDAAISVHCNSSTNSTANGHEVIYRNDKDLDLGEPINHVMNELLSNRDRGLKNDETDLGRKLALLNTPDIPTVIVEPGFLSNEYDRDILLDTEMLADVLVKGITRWANQQVA